MMVGNHAWKKEHTRSNWFAVSWNITITQKKTPWSQYMTLEKKSHQRNFSRTPQKWIQQDKHTGKDRQAVVCSTWKLPCQITHHREQWTDCWARCSGHTKIKKIDLRNGSIISS